MPKAPPPKEAWEKYDKSKLADEYRERCKADLKYFYLTVLDQAHRGLGRVHDFLIDFLRLHELQDIPLEYCHSPIRQYLPPRNEDKEFVRERWLYFRTLNSEPEIQDGPDGPISTMFHTKFWRGTIVRVAGDALTKCVLLPRGHLKSTIGTEAHAMWELIRDPSLRNLVYCETFGLAKDFVRSAKWPFESNDVFQGLFGNLKLPGRSNTVWNETEMQLASETHQATPSIVGAGEDTELTGKHFDRIRLDDIVGRQNVRTADLRAKTKLNVQHLAPIGDPGSHFTDIGTLWSDDDAHGMFTRPEYEQYESSSFIVATVVDDSDNMLWPEKFNEKVLKKLRAKCPDDYTWFCQYYNQPLAGQNNTFNTEWLRYYDDLPEELAARERLDIFITVDPASTEGKKSDYTACVVQGQTPDGRKRYVLDGFRDRIRSENVPLALLDIAMKWQDIAKVVGTSFRMGVESYSFQTFIAPALRDLLIKKDYFVAIEELDPKRRAKHDRIRKLAAPFSTGKVWLPRTLQRRPQNNEGDTYDFVKVLVDEFTRHSGSSGMGHDDVLDALAYIEDMLNPVTGDEPGRAVPKVRGIDETHTREAALADDSAEPDVVERRMGRGIPWVSRDQDGGRQAETGYRDVPQMPGGTGRHGLVRTGRFG